MNPTFDCNLIDQHVGKKLRRIREASGVSQQQLGDFLNISSQQIQKYEQGTNRVSASKLFACAQVLNVLVEYFFEEILETGIVNNNMATASRGDVEMISFFSTIKDKKVKTEIKRFIKTIIDAQ